MPRKGIGGHQSTKGATDDWITPRFVLDSLGDFDLDPCASMTQPWPTAKEQYTVNDNGLLIPWTGRVFCNPPYGLEAATWLMRLAQHGNGIALIFARVETEMWFQWIWNEADAILFLHGRLTFHHPDGTRAEHNAGGPSALVAYGARNVAALVMCGLPGKLVHLKTR